MLQLVDRVALAVSDMSAAIEFCEDIFGSLVVDDIFDREGCARRVSVQLGESLFELLEPRGPGPVLDFIEQHRQGAFALGLAVSDPEKFASSLRAKGLLVYTQTPRRFVVFPDDCRGCGFTITKSRNRARVGLVSGINRVTFRVADLQEAVAYVGGLLDIDLQQVDYCNNGSVQLSRAIVWLDKATATFANGIEWILAGSGSELADQPAGDAGSSICGITINTTRLADLCDRAVRQGYDWSDNDASRKLCLPQLNNLRVSVIAADFAGSKAISV